jgi:cytochrome c oxidase assembly protein subunit 15
MDTSLPRLRAIAVPARVFRWIALTSAVMLLLIVASGATVRLTSSGLGCPEWPGCQGALQLPAKGHHHLIEFSNRIISAVTIIATLLTWLASLRVATMPLWARRTALATFLGTIAQAPLGAIIVYYDLNPWLVLSHFLLSLTILALGVIVALEAWNAHGDTFPRSLRWLGLGVGASCAALVATGTLATAAGRFPGSFGSKPIERVGNFYDAIYVHVRATAIFGILFAALLVWLAARRSRHLWTGLAVLAVLAIQMTVGELQYRVDMVWWLVLIHVSLAATLWAVTVAFVTMLWRPSRIP